MSCNIMSDLQRYLRRFNEILNQMQNQMLCRTSISDVSIDFCECMIPCCQGVINMCQNVLQYTNNEQLREFCNNTIESKNNQISELEEIKDSTYGFVNTASDLNTYISQYLSICRNMFCNMATSANCVNLSFICQMIPCQEGIICLCENCLQCCIDPRLRTLCQNMIEEQNEGINTLRGIGNRICNG